MTGFNDPNHELRRRISALEKRLASLSVEDIWQPIVTCSTTDGEDVELRFPDASKKTGHFSPQHGRWMVKTDLGHGPLEGLYPAHWRRLALREASQT